MHKDRATTILKTHPLVKELLPEGEHLRVYVDRGSEAIPILMAVLSEQGITVSTVTLSRPTLDDVYLKYSGVSFKEGEGGEVTNPWWEKWQKGSGGGSNKWWKGEQEDTETPNEEAVKAVEGESQRSDQAAWPENGGNGSAAKPAWEESSPKDWQKWQAASSVSDDGEKPVVEGEKEPDWKQWQAQWGKKDG
jgi:ABC-2 type transport system ATP-binding protein